MKQLHSHNQENRKAAVMPLVVILLPVMLIFAAYSINVAYMQLVRAELRTATDAASRAGSRKLSLSQDTDQAEVRAIEAAARNVVAGKPLLLRSSDLEWGMSEPAELGDRWEFVAVANTDDMKNSLRVTGSRTATSLGGSLPLIFPQFTTGPFEPTKSATATQIDRDLCLVLDRSGSMIDRIGGSDSTKWGDMQESVEGFLEALEATPQDEKIALVTYSTFATLDQELTLDYDLIRDAMYARLPAGATAVGEGTALGRQAVTNETFARRYAAKTIVVLTDGNHNVGRFPDTVARVAQENYGVTVHAIAFGDDANEGLMRRTAEAGRGFYWKATTPKALTETFTDIANNLPTLLTN